MFSFSPVADQDFAEYEYEIYNSSTVSTGSFVASGKKRSNVFVVSVANSTQTISPTTGVPTNVTTKYWGRVRAVNTSGVAGPWTTPLVTHSGNSELISDQYIGTLTAGKITAGIIGAHEIILRNPSGTPTAYTPPSATSVIRSSDYVAGSSGWIIRGDGTAEFGAASIRGTLAAKNLYIDAFNRWGRNSTNTADETNVFVVGKDANSQIYWDGLSLTVKGSLVTGNTVTGGSVGGLSVGTDTIYLGSGNYSNANTPFFVGMHGGVNKFSIGNKLYFDGTNLTVDGSITIGSKTGTQIETGVNNANSALQSGNGVSKNSSNQITQISGTGVTITSNGNTSANRVQLDSNGLKAYNSSGTNTVSINSDGSASFLGSIVSGSTITGATFSSSNNLFKIDSSGNAFANNIYATGSTGGTDGGLQIKADGSDTSGNPISGATNGNIFIYHGRPNGATTYSIRLGGPTTYANGVAGGYQYFSINQLINQPAGPASVTRLQSSTNAIQIDSSYVGIGGRPSSSRTLFVHGDIILGSGDDAYDILSKNFSNTLTSSHVSARVDDSTTSGYRYIADPSSLRELKENIQDISIEEALNTIKTLRPRKFTWKPSAQDTEYTTQLRRMDIDYGFIAEEIEESNKRLATYRISEEMAEAWPNITDEMVNNMKLKYYKNETLVPLTMKVVQNLIERVEYLEAQLAAQ